ncbi:MAG: hypothetical protein ACLTBL_11560 [Clostridium sp.]
MAQREALSQVRISVRNLVEFVMRSGDLDDRRMAGAKRRLCRPEAVCTGRSSAGWARIIRQR